MGTNQEISSNNSKNNESIVDTQGAIENSKVQKNPNPMCIFAERVPFVDRVPSEMHIADLNPYVEQYFGYGAPVLVGKEAPKYRDDWSLAFERKAPLCLELGSGNGFFLTGMAHKYPQYNWLGVEIRYKRVIMVAKKLKTQGVTNARIMRYDNWCLDDLFLQSSIAHVYCNHPDPWSKDKQASKRILGKPFATWMAWAMQSGGEWRIKTDFRTHIDTMLEVVKGLPFAVVGVAYDAHKNGFPWDSTEDVMTNYESKFVQRNEPIYALRLRKM